MKIICSKEEFAEMLTHCVTNHNNTVDLFNACGKCALYEQCSSAYVDALTQIIEIEETNT